MSSRSSNDATDGAFKIKESSFRQFISRQPGAEFPPEKGRYHLYISYACPWASKCYAFMKLKGLEDDVIGLTVSLFSSLLFSSPRNNIVKLVLKKS
jgi:putative glutathione S-transferase